MYCILTSAKSEHIKRPSETSFVVVTGHCKHKEHAVNKSTNTLTFEDNNTILCGND